jgi:phage N-6-adenine-methyltransferase
MLAIEGTTDVSFQMTLGFRESVIQSNIDSVGLAYVAIGRELAEISEGRLYKQAGYSTFEDYCEKRWGWTRDNGYKYMRAAGVAANVEPVLQSSQPSLRQSLELASLPPVQQVEVAAKVDFSTATVREVREAVKEVKQQSEPQREQAPVVEPVAPQAPSKLSVHFSSDSPEWYTPPEVLALVEKTLGFIDLDPCCNSIGQPNVNAAKYFKQADNGLSADWNGRVYMNPPYGRGIEVWVEKLVAAYMSGNVSEAIALVPARVDTDWFRKFRDYAICFVDGRLKFSGHENSAPFPSAVVYLGGDIDKFYEAFSPLGDIWVRWQK